MCRDYTPCLRIYLLLLMHARGGWLAAGGLVYAWGGNEYGQCGVHWGARDVVEPTPCVPSLRVVQVAAGGMHSCVLTNQGEARARDSAGRVGTFALRLPGPLRQLIACNPTSCTTSWWLLGMRGRAPRQLHARIPRRRRIV